MLKIDYNKIAQIYDDVREGDVELINTILREVPLKAGSRVLDVGCGTGNYTILFQQLTGCRMVGVEPSEGMLAKARAKVSRVEFSRGNAADVPFDDACFDFIFMTDVIHHVPDIRAMFRELKRALKPGGRICVGTQSHAQIEKRPIVQFFPGTAAADKARYPDIPVVNLVAEAAGLLPLKVMSLGEGKEILLDADYLELVEKKGFSMLHLISDGEYEDGLARLRAVLAEGPLPCRAAGASLVWLKSGF